MKEIKEFKFGRRSMDDNDKEKGFFVRVLPVLFMEYLALSLARTLFPGTRVNFTVRAVFLLTFYLTHRTDSQCFRKVQLYVRRRDRDYQRATRIRIQPGLRSPF